MVFLLPTFNLHYRVFSLRLLHYFLCLLAVFGCKATVASPSWSCLQAMLILFNLHFSTAYVCSIVCVCVCVLVCVCRDLVVWPAVSTHTLLKGPFWLLFAYQLASVPAMQLAMSKGDADCSSSSLSVNWIASGKKLLWHLGGRTDKNVQRCRKTKRKMCRKCVENMQSINFNQISQMHFKQVLKECSKGKWTIQ